jgi:hypothetical protein
LCPALDIDILGALFHIHVSLLAVGATLERLVL